MLGILCSKQTRGKFWRVGSAASPKYPSNSHNIYYVNTL